MPFSREPFVPLTGPVLVPVPAPVPGPYLGPVPAPVTGPVLGPVTAPVQVPVRSVPTTTYPYRLSISIYCLGVHVHGGDGAPGWPPDWPRIWPGLGRLSQNAQSPFWYRSGYFFACAFCMFSLT